MIIFKTQKFNLLYIFFIFLAIFFVFSVSEARADICYFNPGGVPLSCPYDPECMRCDPINGCSNKTDRTPCSSCGTDCNSSGPGYCEVDQCVCKSGSCVLWCDAYCNTGACDGTVTCASCNNTAICPACTIPTPTPPPGATPIPTPTGAIPTSGGDDDDDDCGGDFWIRGPENVCIEDGADFTVRQHQKNKFHTLHVDIDHINGEILPDYVIVCEVGDFVEEGGDQSCTWDTMHIENAHNYSDFNHKLPPKYLTGPYPVPPNQYKVNVWYPGAGGCDTETASMYTNLIHCNYKTIGGRVTDATKITEPIGIAGVRIEVYNFPADSYRYPVTNSSGYWSVNDLVGTGDFYSVRVTGNLVSPQTAPAGYLSPAKTNEDGWNWDYCKNPYPGTTTPYPWADTPLGSPSYECQRAGMGNDCAGPGKADVDKRCSFSYDPDPSLLLPCPTSLSATCNADGKATFSWAVVTGAFSYTLRVDRLRYAPDDWDPVVVPPDSNGLDDFAAGPTGTSFTHPLGVGVSWQWSIHPVKEGEDYFPWQPNVCYAKPLYCPVIVVPTPTPRPQVSWFQTTGGDIQSQGDITSIIPACAVSRYLSKKGEGGSPGVVGYVGSLNLGVAGGKVSETLWQAKTRYAGQNTGFDYLANRLKVNRTDNLGIGDIDISSLADGVYYSSSSKDINDNFPGGKIVIFVDGDVTVADDIVVNLGDFFALIAKGDITFLGTPPDVVRKAQGFFLAGGAINIPTSGNPDQNFEGQGSFVGWEGINLTRDLGPGNQNCNPAEAFIERPDFYINAPDSFKLTNSYFKEIEP